MIQHHASIVTSDRPKDDIGNPPQSVKGKSLLRFEPPLWRLQDIFVALRAMEPDEWRQITAPTASDKTLMQSGGRAPG